jgi:hypothetical protein
MSTISEQYDQAVAAGNYGLADSLLFMIPREELPPDMQAAEIECDRIREEMLRERQAAAKAP